jgi:hypothetical protein
MTVFSDGDKEMTMTPIRSYTLLQKHFTRANVYGTTNWLAKGLG